MSDAVSISMRVRGYSILTGVESNRFILLILPHSLSRVIVVWTLINCFRSCLGKMQLIGWDRYSIFGV